MKDNSKNPFETPERKHYKKRYLIRKAEEQEAEQEIEQMPMMQDHDLNQLNLPDVIQNEVQ